MKNMWDPKLIKADRSSWADRSPAMTDGWYPRAVTVRMTDSVPFAHRMASNATKTADFGLAARRADSNAVARTNSVLWARRTGPTAKSKAPLDFSARRTG